MKYYSLHNITLDINGSVAQQIFFSLNLTILLFAALKKALTNIKLNKNNINKMSKINGHPTPSIKKKIYDS